MAELSVFNAHSVSLMVSLRKSRAMKVTLIPTDRVVAVFRLRRLSFITSKFSPRKTIPRKRKKLIAFKFAGLIFERTKLK